MIRYLLNAITSIFSPMPLNDFGDYDNYWTQRLATGLPGTVLPRYQWIADRIPDGASVIDIGCGDGAFLAYLRSRNPSSTLFGVDIAATAIARLKERGIEGARIDGSTPLRGVANRDMDVAVLMEVLEHTVEAEALFKEALSFTPRQIFVTLPNAGFIVHRLRLMFGGRFPVTTILYHVKEHVRFWTVRDFRQWASAMGCHVTACAGQAGGRNPLSRLIVQHFPSLFAAQVIFELTPLSK